MTDHNFYAVITASVLLDPDLSDHQKLLIALISNLSNQRGYCFASNDYLARCLSKTTTTVSTNLSDLVKKGYLKRMIKTNDKKEIIERILKILPRPLPSKIEIPLPSKIAIPPLENRKDKNKEEKDLSLKEENPLLKSNLFRQPTRPDFDAVLMVFKNNGGTEEQAQAFFNKHTATDWFLNGSPIKNFAALASSFITNWQRNETKNEKRNEPGGSGAPKLTRG